MPVSRKRKKKNAKSGRRPRPQAFAWGAGLGDQARELAAGRVGFDGYRRRLDERRASLALAAAEPLVAELVGQAGTLSDADLEDELCRRVGRVLADLADGPIDDHVGPNTLAEAVIDAAVNAADAALSEDLSEDLAEEPTEEPGEGTGGRARAWRVLTAVTRVVNHPLSDEAVEAIDGLRSRHGARLVPGTPAGPGVTGPVLWARDAYGSRVGVVAPFGAAGGRDRWYLWDIDACGHEPFTIHSGYYVTADAALADWQAGVGAASADGAVFGPVDDPGLLDELMPREQGILRLGGENVEQFAEYHRSKRLAEAVIDALEPSGPSPGAPPADLDAATAGPLFAAWLREHRSDRPLPVDLDDADLDDLITELAGSWQVGGPDRLYRTCSPHRVALVADHVSDFYQDDFAASLVGLLPDWAAWLAERNATPAHLADRCRPGAYGESQQALSADDGRLNWLARVTE